MNVQEIAVWILAQIAFFNLKTICTSSQTMKRKHKNILKIKSSFFNLIHLSFEEIEV